MKKLFDAANRYIETSDWKVFAVLKFCLTVGYKDVDYFINRFIEDKGCTPAKFRKQIKG